MEVASEALWAVLKAHRLDFLMLTADTEMCLQGTIFSS